MGGVSSVGRWRRSRHLVRSTVVLVGSTMVLSGGVTAAGAAGTEARQTVSRADILECDPNAYAQQVFAGLGGLAAMAPGGGQVAGLLSTLSTVSGAWTCGPDNVAQSMIEIAKQQAKIVFDEESLEIFSNTVDDEVATLDDLEYKPDDSEYDQQEHLKALYRVSEALGTAEQTGRVLDNFGAIPGMATLASIKLATLSAAIDLEMFGISNWKTLVNERRTEAEQSLSYLDELESKLEEHIGGRYAIQSETISTTCGTVHCIKKIRVYVTDRAAGGRVWQSDVLTMGGSASEIEEQQKAYQAALTQAGSEKAKAEKKIRDIYLTDEYRAIKQGLRAHRDAETLTLFRLGYNPCDKDNYMVLKSLDGRTMKPRSGTVDMSQIVLSTSSGPTLDSQFDPMTRSGFFRFKARAKPLAMQVYGDSQAGLPLVLHGDENYADTHSNSLFIVHNVVKDENDKELILQARGEDLTLSAISGNDGSGLTLRRTVAAAEKNDDSRFTYECRSDSSR